MSVAAETRAQAAPRPVVVVALLAVAAGAALGTVLVPDAPEAPAPRSAAPQPRTGLASGVAKLPLPAGWKPLGRLSTLPGFGKATAVRGEHTEMALDIRSPEHPSLLPASVAAAAGDLRQPQPRRFGTRTAWRYELPAPASVRRVVAFVLPTTGGVVTFACAAVGDAIVFADADCGEAVRTVRLDDASALAPAPEAAARIVLPETFAQLNRRRRDQRRQLAATRSPQRRAAAALRLADGYAAAARRLRPLAAGDVVRLTATLDALARSHRVLATASRQRTARRARRAGARIARAERRLALLLAKVTRS